MLTAPVAYAAPRALLYRGIQPGRITTATDQHGRDFPVAGMSGIMHADGNVYWAVMDDSDKLLKFEILLREDGAIRRANLQAGLTLSEWHDSEGIALTDKLADTVLVSEEDTPGIHAFDLRTGKKLWDVTVPEVYLHGRTWTNQGFESLTFSPDGKTLWTANERALTIDGNTKLMGEPFGARTRVRLQRFDVKGEKFTPSGQFVYQTSGVHDLGGQIGLSDLAALPDGRLLALERSAAMGLHGRKSIRTRIFLVDVAGATDVSADKYANGLGDLPIVQASKTPLYDGLIFDDDGENLEGLCLGPQLGKDRWSVLGVVDSTDGIGVSGNRIVAFELMLNP